MSNIIWIVVLLLVLRFVVKYVLPIVRVVNGASRKMREMQNGAAGTAPTQPQSRRSVPPKKGDYIDFEEMK